jgi:hypothetical protein
MPTSSKRHVDVLALARAGGGVVAHMQRRQNGVAGVHAGKEVDHRHAHAQRAAAGLGVGAAGDAHHAGHGLHHEVVARALGIGAVLPEAGDRAVNEARVEGAQALVVQPVLLQAPDLEVLHHDVGLQCHLLDERLALGRGHVDGDRALVAVAGREIAGLRGVVALGVLQKGRAPLARVVTQAGALHLHHIGPQVGQHLGAPGASEHAGEVEHLDARQGASGGGAIGHGYRLLLN